MTVEIETPAAVPGDVASAAAAKDLGGHRESYPAANPKQLLLAIGCFGGLFLVAAIAVTIGAASSETDIWMVAGIAWLLALPFLAGFVYVLLRSPLVSKPARRLQVHVFERGWVWVRKTGAEVYRFDEVQTLFASVVVVNTTVATTTTSYDYNMTFTDGRKARMRQVHTDMARFGPLLATEVAQAQLPKAMSHFDQGNPVGFGDLTVTEDGVATAKGKLVPWEQVGGVQVEQGYLWVVGRDGKRATPRVNFGLTANAYTFLLMMRTILTKVHGA